MDKAAFAHWLGGLALLDAAQRLRVVAELTGDGAAVAAPDGAQHRGISGDAGGGAAVMAGTQVSSAGPAADLMSQLGAERLARFGCPHCDAEDVQRWGRAAGKPRYRCTSCRRTFNPLTGTPLAGLHYPQRWGDQAQALIAGETVAKAAKRCKIN